MITTDMMLSADKRSNTLVQCDFDGTITEEDVSFVLLDTFTDGKWRNLLHDYREGRITVGYLNRQAFAMVRADEKSLVEAMRGRYRIREGFKELLDYCRDRGFRFAIVSNGLDFYINNILKDLGLRDIEVHAARTRFHPEGLEVEYVGPEGSVLDDGFKEAYADSFLRNGNRVIYAGNGASDFPAARKCHHIFATGELLTVCRRETVDCTTFSDLNDIKKGLEFLLDEEG